MKTIFTSLVASLLTIMGCNAFAQTTVTPAAVTPAVTKVTISGEPVTVVKSGDYYTFSGTTTYTTTSDYYYLTVDGNKQVCYREVQSTFAGVTPSDMSLKIGNDIVAVHCYSYSPEYFEVQ